ncbi:MAG TPA: hypothetical protein EYP25_04050 [Anaerolineae bacterium]|nr:hypothetical protein [Anaerolineae bacterium]
MVRQPAARDDDRLPRGAGRIGDSPIPGAEFYAADGLGAVATTGQGEHIIHAGLSFLVMRLLAAGLPAAEAASHATEAFLAATPQGKAGWIVVDAAGGVGVGHTSRNIAYAWRTSNAADFVTGVD